MHHHSNRQQDYTMLFFTEDFISNERFPIVRGADGFIRTGNLPDDLTPYYGSAYYGELHAEGRRFVGVIERGVTWFRGARARLLRRLHPQAGRVLDIGCGRGVMLAQLQSQGWEPVGTEIAPELAAAHGFPVYVQADLAACGFAANSFDAVTMWHTLEHIRDPFATLDEIARIVKPGGTILIEVPNFASWQSQLTRGGWFHLDVPRHTYHFTARQVVRMLESHGFKIVQVGTFSLEYGYYGFVQSVLNMATTYPNFLYSLLRKQPHVLTQRLPVSLWDVLVTLLLLPVVVPVALVVETLAAVLGYGSVVRVVGVKPD